MLGVCRFGVLSLCSACCWELRISVSGFLSFSAVADRTCYGTCCPSLVVVFGARLKFP